MSSLLTISGAGAVSPAGWTSASLLAAVRDGAPLPVESLAFPAAKGETAPPEVAARTRPARRAPLPPPAEIAAGFAGNARFRRASPVSRFAAAAALEALGPERLAASREGRLRLGVVFSLLNGCVNYTGRFFGEVLADPASASPILFPETVFNAPASHVAALCGVTGPVNTLVGDRAQFFPAVEMAADWLLAGEVDGCLVIGAEEADWLTAEALALLAPGAILSEGAGALYLERTADAEKLPGEFRVFLTALHGPVPLTNGRSREAAARALRESPDFAAAAADAGALLVDDRCGDARTDRAAREFSNGWTGPAWSPGLILGEGQGACGAWQGALAARAVASGFVRRALAVNAGGNQGAAGLELARTD